MKVAHFSDLHLLALAGVPIRRFLNKRLTGWLNLRLKRGSRHRASYVRAIAREVRRLDVDHVVITGDLTNLALEGEFALALAVIEEDLGIEPGRLTITPGNHDLYTRGSLTSRRFARTFARYLDSDLPDLAVDAGGGRFPVVKLREGVAFVALSSAMPDPPLVAAGEIGSRQLAALGRVLAHPEVARRTVVLALHHPVSYPWSRLKAYTEGLRDAPALLRELRVLPRGLILHGHLHRRMQRSIDHGRLLEVGATSASLHDEEPDRMAGFNVYEIGSGAGRGDPLPQGQRVAAYVYSPDAGTFHLESIPRHV